MVTDSAGDGIDGGVGAYTVSPNGTADKIAIVYFKLAPLCDARGMHGADLLVNLEIVHIERQQVLNAVRLHHRDQAGIVDLFAFDGVSPDQVEPDGKPMAAMSSRNSNLSSRTFTLASVKSAFQSSPFTSFGHVAATQNSVMTAGPHILMNRPQSISATA